MATMHKTRRCERASVAAALLMAGALVTSEPALARPPLTRWNKNSLKQDFAKTHYTTVKQVEELQVYILKQARGVEGFTLGRFRTKDGKYSRGGVTIYYTCGKELCLSRASFSADKMQVVRLLDLSDKETSISVSGGAWFALRSGEVKEPPRRARWPVLVVKTEQTYDRTMRQKIHLISLKRPARPAVMARITTLSTQKGGPSSSSRGSRRGPRRGPPRFNGTRVTSLRAVKAPGKPPRLVVTKQRISTRFNRCKQRKPKPVYWDLKDGGFGEPLGKLGGLGGCR
jgi:hypothetical protein